MNGKLRKIVCSIIPYCIERLYTTDKYNLKKSPLPVRILLMLLPSAFVYIVSNYEKADKRTLKYWLPYGVMRNYQLKNYGKKINGGYHSRLAKILRWLLPFGYVLWWDKSKQQENQVKPAVNNRKVSSVDSVALSRIEEKLTQIQHESQMSQHNQLEMVERLEVGLLKLAIEIRQINS